MPGWDRKRDGAERKVSRVKLSNDMGVTCSECGNAGSIDVDARAPSVFSMVFGGGMHNLIQPFERAVALTPHMYEAQNTKPTSSISKQQSHLNRN